jgi:hypothetical protein
VDVLQGGRAQESPWFIGNPKRQKKSHKPIGLICGLGYIENIIASQDRREYKRKD